MKILVTGATGKVGSRLAKRLAQRGDHVRVLAREAARAVDLRDAGLELALGDLLEQDTLVAAVRSVDAVVHCAAFFRGATPEQAHAVNDRGTQQLASAARAARVKRFVFTSTGLVYGSTGGRLAREDDACSPTAPYPVSKLAAERFLLATEDLDVRVLRLPFVYGDGDPHIEEVVPFRRAYPPAQRKSIAHHVDVAQAVGRLLDAPPPDGSDPERARAFDTLLDGRRIREELGFTPKFPRLADAIAAGLNQQAESITPADALEYFGGLAHLASLDLAASSAWTQTQLDWKPTGSSLLNDVQNMDYAAPEP